MEQSQKRELILASASPHRKMLLERLGLAFDVSVSAVDETPRPGETADVLVARLAAAKAQAVAHRFPAAVVIGSDQVAECGGETVGKPGSEGKAIAQLTSFSGRTVRFLTAVAVQCLDSGFDFRRSVSTEVRFRPLAQEEIERYVARDRPLDCAGSFKSEQAGIALLEAMSSTDPTAIVGLPLIAVAEALRQSGFRVP